MDHPRTPSKGFTPSRTGDARVWLLRRLGDLVVLGAGIGLALPLIVPFS